MHVLFPRQISEKTVEIKIPEHTHHHAAEINSDPEGGVSVSSGGESETLVR